MENTEYLHRLLDIKAESNDVTFYNNEEYGKYEVLFGVDDFVPNGNISLTEHIDSIWCNVNEPKNINFAPADLKVLNYIN